MLKLVRFRCGCIGTEPVNGLTQIVSRDSVEGYELGMPEDHQPTEPGYDVVHSTDPVYGQILAELQLLIRQGYRYRQIKQALEE